jgi:hypothetical protein
MTHEIKRSHAVGAQGLPFSVDLRQAASLLGVSEDVVRERIENGRLAGGIYDGQWRVLLAEPVDLDTGAPAMLYPSAAAALVQLEAIRDAWLTLLVAQIRVQAEEVGRLRERHEDAERRAAEAETAAARIAADAERERIGRQTDAAQADQLVGLIEDGVRALVAERDALAAELGRAPARVAGEGPESNGVTGQSTEEAAVARKRSIVWLRRRPTT